jgi:hypothetical protein
MFVVHHAARSLMAHLARDFFLISPCPPGEWLDVSHPHHGLRKVLEEEADIICGVGLHEPDCGSRRSG